MPNPKDNHVYVYDRCEDSLYVLIGDSGSISVSALPEGACCGDSFVYSQGVFAPLTEETAARKQRIDDKFNRLFGK